LARKVMLMNKNILRYGLITSLLVNFTIGGRYLVDTKEYQKQINIQDKIIEQNKSKQRLLEEYSLKNTEKIDDLYIKNSLLTDELNKAKIENTQLKTENDKLKKDLANRKEVSKQKKFYVEATSYIAKCTEGCSGYTYTQYDVRNTIYYNGLRIIASDNSILPLYSIVNIKTNNNSFKAIVLDRGGGINGYEIDLLARNTTEAINFGRQKVLITVIRNGKG
jgi:3D (Asp-Asp-Asp) domain-containing protein